ncbi:hypothetical protein JW921_05175 [Candidatus Fermentibacterales bacterium]|nr:hypothetical protein [Candidatus Fermentibacterales bacterium]
MRALRWTLGAIVLIAVIVLIIHRPPAMPFFPDMPFAGFVTRALYILVLAALLVLFRIRKGPTAADRVMAIDILGVLIVGICAVVSIATQRSWYIDIAIAWALQSFIGALAFAKYLEGRSFDD